MIKLTPIHGNPIDITSLPECAHAIEWRSQKVTERRTDHSMAIDAMRLALANNEPLQTLQALAWQAADTWARYQEIRGDE